MSNTNFQSLQTILYSNTVDLYLRAGAMNNYVISLQELLNRLGHGRELLFSIYGADGYYGENVVGAVRAFASRQGLSSNGMAVSPSLLSRMLEAVQGGRPSQPTQPAQPTRPAQPTQPVQPSRPTAPAAGLNQLRITDQGARVLVSDGRMEVAFTKRDLGLVFNGLISIEQAIDRDRSILLSLGITPSALNVMKSVSENEGKLDAINTYDRAFLSFGIFQWTIGSGDGPGELPALLSRFKQRFPADFQRLFGAYGLDVSLASETSGYLILHGNRIDQAVEKEQFRGPTWAFVFWQAGQDPEMQALEIEYALGRLRTFYWSRSPSFMINNFTLSEIITSEYGVALLLDHHVNRPAYVKPSIELAMRQTGLMNPTFWSTREEMQVLQAYLSTRATYTTGTATPMTKAHERAAVTKRYLDRGIISAERQSFHYGPQMVA